MQANNKIEEIYSLPYIKKEIKKAGGLFYQYKGCRRNYSTIYDIENIRNGVVFAQTPLNMNDPFDSQIGFSAEKIYNECIDLLLNALDIKDDLNLILFYLLKFKLLGRFSELIIALNELKQFIISQRVVWHKRSATKRVYCTKHKKLIFKMSKKY